MKFSQGLIILIIALLHMACQEASESPWTEDWKEEGEQFSGGDATISDESVNAFGHAAPNLTGDKDLQFVTGNSFFKRNWVTAPASTEDLDGLGPLFNARSCSSCHDLDGRGAPPLSPDEQPVSLLFRLSKPSPDIAWETIPDEHYGEQLNTLAILGIKPEGDVSVSYQEISGTYADGETYSLRKPNYAFKNLKYGAFSHDMMVSPRIAPQMIGLGLLEAIDEATLQSFADPDDANGDGISGRINYVEDRITQKKSIGRLGWKANQPSVRQQIASAFRGDIGITSSLFPEQPCASQDEDCLQSISGGEPELTEDILDRVTLYSETLAVPIRRNWNDAVVLQGKSLFNQSGCTSCHIATIKTGIHPDYPEFSDQTIHPYTDLLLHDMGEGLADGRPDGEASGTEWKTPPLWGIGLMHVVSGHTFLLHDGRARNMEEAILWHGGEAQKSQQAFVNMSKTEREAVLKFLESL